VELQKDKLETLETKEHLVC